MQNALKAGLRAVAHIRYTSIDASFTMAQEGDVTNTSLSSKDGAMDLKFVKAPNDMVDMSQSNIFGPIMLHTDIDIHGKEKAFLLDFALDQFEFGFLASFADDIDVDDSDPDHFITALNSGLAVSINGLYDGLDSNFSATMDSEVYAGDIRSATAEFGISFDRDSLHYSSGMGNTSASLTAPQMPIGPLEFSASEIRTKTQLPSNVSNEPAPFSYSGRYIDLSISENLWAMFDPGKLLPRGPATYILDLEGMGNWLIDPFSEAFENKTSEATKGELHSLTLNEFKLSAAGAEATGTGDFRFNNDDLETFKGIPAPIGTLDLKFVGINALIDTLLKIGLLQEDQAFGARMGLGLIAVAGDGEDTLISNVIVTSEGKVTANGKRLK